MERILSEEEKIKRAMEILQRRNREYSVPKKTIERVNAKKDYRLFKRMTLQLIICMLVYGIFYLITTTNYFFSAEVIKQTTSILSYDIQFENLYRKSIDKTKELLKNYNVLNTDQSQNNEIGEPETKQEKDVSLLKNLNTEELISISQMEKDALEVKKICEFEKPISGKITSEFGEREVTSKVMTSDHKGIDIATKEGTEIKSAITGQVEQAGYNSKYGNYVKIKKDEVLTLYAHCSKIDVSKGDEVKKGNVIAKVGSTGNSTGPHLHFEIRLSDRYINPRLVIQF